MRTRWLSLGALALLCASSVRTQAQVTRRNLPEAQAQALLRAPVKMDARAAAVLRRSAQSYGRLQTLLTESDAAGVKTITRLKRPRYMHSLQHAPSGELIGLSISDGRSYYEYEESSRKYLQRDASILSRLAVPLNARPFFADVSRGAAMQDVKGRPTVREFAFAYAGEEKVNGKPADRLRVSTLIRGRNGWRTFDATRSYDRKTGFLVGMVSGSRVLTIKNQPNVKLPTEGFVWKPIPGATRSFD